MVPGVTPAAQLARSPGLPTKWRKSRTCSRACSRIVAPPSRGQRCLPESSQDMDAAVTVSFGDRNYEPQIRLEELHLGNFSFLPAKSDFLGQLDLTVACELRHPAHLAQ